MVELIPEDRAVDVAALLATWERTNVNRAFPPYTALCDVARHFASVARRALVAEAEVARLQALIAREPS